jgi:multiple sugar transport system ATP-binding protein
VKAVTLERVEKTYADGTRAVRGVDLAIEPGELVVLLGPSGCGKTTTLRMIAGLETPTGGRIRLGADDVTALSPAQRDVGFVFQFYALYPHLTVRENLAFPLRCSGVARAERERRVGEVAERLGIARLLALHPRRLSGGDQQRVALGRAMVRRPSVWLMDEPLGTLDADLRLAMCEFLRAQQLEHRVTTVYVTHDQEEALRLADRIVVMAGGAILQADRAAAVYDEPADLFVARFVGSPGMNFVEGEVVAPNPHPHPKPPPTLGGRGQGPTFAAVGDTRRAQDPRGTAQLPLPPRLATVRPGPATLGIRPEHVALDAASALRGTVAFDEYLGATRCLHVDTPLGRLIARVASDAPGARDCARGAEVGLALDPAHLRLFDPRSGARLA